MKPWNFTVEETNLIAIYYSSSRSELLERLRAAQLLFGPGASAAAVPPEGGGADRRRICQPDV